MNYQRSILAGITLLLSFSQPICADVNSNAFKPPEAWEEWAIWADGLYPVGDEEGHGPDLGTDEWAYALAAQLGVDDKAGHGPDLKSTEWCHALERKLILYLPPKAWDEWAKWADGLHPVGDDGHGPDPGSDEWASALASQLGVNDKAGHGPDLKSAEWRRAVERLLTKERQNKRIEGNG